MRQLTAYEFGAVMLLIFRMSPKRREAARLALVEGKTEQAIAEHYGWCRSAVSNAEATVWKMYQRYIDAKKHELIHARPLPKGRGRVTISASRSVLPNVQGEVTRAAQGKGR